MLGPNSPKKFPFPLRTAHRNWRNCDNWAVQLKLDFNQLESLRGVGKRVNYAKNASTVRQVESMNKGRETDNK